MPHAQQQILEAVKAAIVLAATNAGARVFLDRVDPLQPSELPAVTIDEGEEGETVLKQTLAGTEQLRELDVRIACVEKGAASAAQARELGLQVEKALENDAALPLLCYSGGFRLKWSRQANSGDGDPKLSGRVQAWQFSYGLSPQSPENIVTHG